jgi:hypothetical protein
MLDQALLGQAMLGHAILGQARLGQARLGQAMLGQAMLGQAMVEQKHCFPHKIGIEGDYAGYHCSWCTSPEGIVMKLRSAGHQDFPRWKCHKTFSSQNSQPCLLFSHKG